MRPVRIGLIGDYDAGYAIHQTTCRALEVSGTRVPIKLEYEWIATDTLASSGTGPLEPFDGIWAAPGGPYQSLDGALDGIRWARLSGRPFIAT